MEIQKHAFVTDATRTSNDERAPSSMVCARPNCRRPLMDPVHTESTAPGLVMRGTARPDKTG